MKKFIKNNLLGFIVGGIIFSFIGVYATVTISSDSVRYDNTNGTLTSNKVKGALDELYQMTENYCPRGYECTLKPLYEYGDPSTSSTTDYTTIGHKVFIKLEGNQKSVCTFKNNVLECFKNNDYENEKVHIENFSGEFSCSAETNGDISCTDFSALDVCNLYSNNEVNCYQFTLID